MDAAKVTVYVASSVGIDYFYFLQKTIESAGYVVNDISFISEASYRRRARSTGLRKLWLRVQMYILYPIYLLLTGLSCKKGSIFVVSSNTFYAPFLVHSLLRFRSISVVHMLYDLYPDALEVAGGLQQDSFLSRVVGSITKANQQRCDGTVYLGKFLKQHAEGRWGKASHSEVIDISTDISLYDSTPPSLTNDNHIIIHYGGQLGYLHDAQSIIACVRRVYESDLQRRVRFIFYVSGAQADYLRKSLSSLPVQIVSTAPSQQWRSDIKAFHIGLVSLTPAGATVCLPSKTYAMMAGGLAILAICPEWSDLANLVQSVDGGWIINNSPFHSITSNQSIQRGQLYFQQTNTIRQVAEICDDFYAALLHISSSPGLLIKKRRNAFHGVRRLYCMDELQRKWGNFLQTL